MLCEEIITNEYVIIIKTDGTQNKFSFLPVKTKKFDKTIKSNNINVSK
jgi:hypothetical protein